MMVRVLLVLFYNHRGEAMAGKAGILDNLLSSATSKALALLRGLETIEDLGSTPIMIESDSLELIKACNGVIEVWNSYSTILAECFMKVGATKDISFQHCFMDANKVSHNLARNVYRSKCNLVWDEDPPDFILADVINDVTLLASQ
jgi:ribonuclease HI